jgi:hypothetical protein
VYIVDSDEITILLKGVGLLLFFPAFKERRVVSFELVGNAGKPFEHDGQRGCFRGLASDSECDFELDVSLRDARVIRFGLGLYDGRCTSFFASFLGGMELLYCE